MTSISTASSKSQLVEVGPLATLESPTVVSGGKHGIAVFISDGKPYAVDNRCPHMGFPLDKGTIRDGILTCHWHHARFDLESGGTFDPFADDVRVYPTEVHNGIVFVDIAPRQEDVETRWKGRLRDGLEQNLGLVIAKSVLALRDRNVSGAEISKIGAHFGARYREDGWRVGLTILSAMNNMLPWLKDEDQVLALYHGMVHIARETSGEPPHFRLDELPTINVPPERIKTWFRSFVEVRDRDGAERALLTAINSGMEPSAIADILFAAATDHFFLDGGHSFDFVNKACEMLDTIGWEHAAEILPSVVPALTNAMRSEELNSWRHPIDLVSLVNEATADLAGIFQTPRDEQWDNLESLAATLLEDDPVQSAAAIRQALVHGAPLVGITRAISYAAAVRIARFHTSNEFSDWITVLHTFTYANALHQAAKRAPSAELARGAFHGAMRIYLDRFLNMPAARLPEHRNSSREPADANELLKKLLDLTDREQQVNESALVVHRYLSLGHDPKPLVATLGHILLREDAEFHSYQMLEAGTALFDELIPVNREAAHRVLVAVVRYLAAHSPTSRAMRQTARTAIRLHRGDAIYEEPSEAEESLAADD